VTFNVKVEAKLVDFIEAEMVQDLAHDMNHVLRVVKTAKSLCSIESAQIEIVVPAAYLHDCFSDKKSLANRRRSSTIAADKAVGYLASIGYRAEYLQAIHHAIVAHSYSANVETTTLEAAIVQDADRLDALGAIGIARCLQVSSSLGRALYCSDDAFCDNRVPDDSLYTVDHFYEKLLSLAGTMKTHSGRAEADKRLCFMQQYLKQLESEVVT
jgi:uncharacterized protein